MSMVSVFNLMRYLMHSRWVPFSKQSQNNGQCTLFCDINEETTSFQIKQAELKEVRDKLKKLTDELANKQDKKQVCLLHR